MKGIDFNDLTQKEVVTDDGCMHRLSLTAEGIVVSEEVCNSLGDVIEVFDFDSDGAQISRVVYDYTSQRQLLKTTSYDRRGDVIYVQNAGKAPVFYGKYKNSFPQNEGEGGNPIK